MMLMTMLKRFGVHASQRWNSKLAELAQTWSDKCAFEHGQPQFSAATLGYEQLGQNLYVNSDLNKGVSAGVQAWFDEKADYNYDSLKCAPGKACGHYTQVSSNTELPSVQTTVIIIILLLFGHPTYVGKPYKFYCCLSFSLDL